MNDLKPSVFCAFPFFSVLQNTESEIVAGNIMKIRRRLGDVWLLTWDQYKEERLKDSGFSEWLERRYFEDVYPRIETAVDAVRFCQEWANAAKTAK